MKLKRIMTLTFVLAAIAAMTIGFSSCGRTQTMMPDAETPSMEDMPSAGITIGVAVALTGEYAEPYGLPMQRGLELAREEINMLGGPSITFVSADPMSTVEGGVAAIKQLVTQDVPALIGIGISTHLQEAFPIAQDAGIVAFSPISSAAGLSGEIGDFVFRTGLATDIITPSGVMATQQKLGYTKVAVIYDAEDTYSTSSKEQIEKALEANEVEILTTETFATGDTDFSTQLTNIMAMEPDALFISALASEIPQIMAQARTIGIPDTVHFIVSELTSAEIQEAGAAAEGAVTFTSWSGLSNIPGNQDFVQNYKTKYGIDPEPWAAQSYATLYILANAIKNAQSMDSIGIRDALAQTMDLPTILGNFSFDPNGEAMYTPVVLIVKDGQLQDFE